jgi:hypothetical protein
MDIGQRQPLQERGGTTSTEETQKKLKAKHHFTMENCPRSNGTIESACKQVIRAFREVLSELKMYADEWPEVINLVQTVNNSLSMRLNKRTPMKVFTGHAETTPLALMLKDNVPVNAPLNFIKAQNLMDVEKLSNAMTEIHAQVAEKDMRDRKAAIQKHNDRTHVRSPNFQVEYYVLVAEHRKSGTSKLQIKWKGPRRVASVDSDYVFLVENLLTKELKAAHASRLRFYKDKELNVTAELAQAAEHNDHQLYVVSKILDARYNEQEIFHKLLVAWRGFPVGEATWEPYSGMAVNVSDMVANFKESQEDIDTVRKMQSL